MIYLWNWLFGMCSKSPIYCCFKIRLGLRQLLRNLILIRSPRHLSYAMNDKVGYSFPDQEINSHSFIRSVDYLTRNSLIIVYSTKASITEIMAHWYDKTIAGESKSTRGSELWSIPSSVLIKLNTINRGKFRPPKSHNDISVRLIWSNRIRNPRSNGMKWHIPDETHSTSRNKFYWKIRLIHRHDQRSFSLSC